MKDINGKIQYKDREYTIVFNLNVMEAIQEKYGSVEAWGDLTDGTKGEPNAKAVIFAFTEMINEGIDIENEEREEKQKFFSLKQVGRIITEIGLANATAKLNQTVIESTKGDSKNE